MRLLGDALQFRAVSTLWIHRYYIIRELLQRIIQNQQRQINVNRTIYSTAANYIRWLLQLDRNVRHSRSNQLLFPKGKNHFNSRIKENSKNETISHGKKEKKLSKQKISNILYISG